MTVGRRRRGHPGYFGGTVTEAPPAEVTVPAVHFDGTNDTLTRGAALTGAASSKEATCSVWIKAATDGAPAKVLIGITDAGAGGPSNMLVRATANTIEVSLVTSAGMAVWLAATTETILIADGWVNILWSINSATGARTIYLNDVLATLGSDTFVADALINWNTATNWTIGAQDGGTSKHNGDMAELWLDDNFIDFSVEANRRKFISAGGKPVELGANGEGPLGAAPLIYLNNPTATWQTNLGTGGGFTENGALTDASSSPSD